LIDVFFWNEEEKFLQPQISAKSLKMDVWGKGQGHHSDEAGASMAI
uniref:Uncharacterized protein n=1 Tax=Otolemur garnettii TaxID=30611 RepID=H0Y146_OTOGA